jgi:hypothetical protein
MSVCATEKKCGTTEYVGAVRRFLRRFGKAAEVGEVDVTSLEQLVTIREEVEEQMALVVRALRSEAGGSYSWEAIGQALGMTRSAAYKKYGMKDEVQPDGTIKRVPLPIEGQRSVGGQPSHLR